MPSPTQWSLALGDLSVAGRSGRRRRRAGVGAGLVWLLLLVPIAGCGSHRPVTGPSRISTPATSAQPTSTSSAPTVAPADPTAGSTANRSPASPTSPTTPAGPNRTLKANSLYRIDLDHQVVTCRIKVHSPRPPVKNADLAPYLRTVVKCLVKAFAKPLAAQGITLTTPKVKTYRHRISTPCGKYGQDIAPAYYCSATQTIYWPQTSDDGREAYTIARLGYVGLLAHEFGHHLQFVTGMLDEYGVDYYAAKKKTSRYLLSRRLELQAQCFEGVFLTTSAKSIDLSRRDRAQLRAWHSYTGDEDPPSDRRPDHGSSKAQLHWLDRGLDSADFGRCNTWKASKSAVK